MKIDYHWRMLDAQEEQSGAETVLNVAISHFQGNARSKMP
jgi:hypothetical protein